MKSAPTCEIPDLEKLYRDSPGFTDLAGDRPPHLTEAELGALAIERENPVYNDMPPRDQNDGTLTEQSRIVLSIN